MYNCNWRVGQMVRLDLPGCELNGLLATIAYLGEDGVSVYLCEGDHPLADECLCMNWNEIYEASI